MDITMHTQTRRAIVLSATAAMTMLLSAPASAVVEPSPAMLTQAARAYDQQASKIEPYRPRFGRTRPVVAVVGENAGTELTDFVIPYGVLVQSGAAEVVTVATKPGLLKMRPALQIQPHATVKDFDARFPDGADYVIVPAVVKRDDPALLAWIAAQGAKGATVVSICDGALVVANTGLMKGHRATGHWATHALRKKQYPDTRWEKNVRYVADGRIVSSAGISAAIPTSLALVEAIAGRDRAAAVAKTLGAGDWGTAHNSDSFKPRLGTNLMAFATTTYTNGWFHSRKSIGVSVAPGVDEIALALTADAYSRTGRSQAYAVAASGDPLKTRNGLIVVPERIVGGSNPVDRILPAFDATPSTKFLDKALAGIAKSFGRTTAYGVALAFEYPGFSR
ncbi:DJ-1/PfpI family protein [Sphingosinicella sp. LY1275]|uniref:DJ-1/PfpI family protein n=1 Tax=Sphingosinicella sp. LY1275 TaxID=3095379 RepID=UPI002ADEDFA5|nr:DJ-1/PfpI family protein [Sphingosinicella sp. LY1275]MEA1015280.1 DJ-1/PfpI family protein [Sphingosinicella sp. LY1275]